MPNLHIVADPPMTRRLVEARAFAEDPLIVVDVGARGGIELFWKVFGDDIRTIAFEPDPEECARLQAIAEKNVTYLPAALGAESGSRTLHVARFSAASSFYPNDTTWCARFDIGDSLAVESRTEVRTTTLREALAGRQPDFIKLDVEGAELDVLRGADLGAVLGPGIGSALQQADVGLPDLCGAGCVLPRRGFRALRSRSLPLQPARRCPIPISTTTATTPASLSPARRSRASR